MFAIEPRQAIGIGKGLLLSRCRIDGAGDRLALLQRRDPAAYPMLDRRQYAGTDRTVYGASYHVQSVRKLAILFLKLCVIGCNILAHLDPCRTP
jgi:hypothetical protein